MYTFATLKEAFKNGTEQLGEDEYLDEEGLPCCSKCKTRRWFASQDGRFATRAMCKCQEAEAKRKRDIEEREKYVEEFRNRRELAGLGERYFNATFSTATITDHNRDAFLKVKNYVQNIPSVLKHNIGLYVYGDNSTGKTFLTACICNELVWRKQRCIYTSFAAIRNAISSSYNGKTSSEGGLLASLRSYDFAFIDDFGKEFLGREFRPDVSKWAEEKLFEVLNDRYNAQKPTIFSSNYSIGELVSVLGLDKAIVERVNEMATRVIRLEGDDFRSEVRKKKSDLAKSLGI